VNETAPLLVLPKISKPLTATQVRARVLAMLAASNGNGNGKTAK